MREYEEDTTMRKMDDQALQQASGGRLTESDIDPSWTNLTREPHSAVNCREFMGHAVPRNPLRLVQTARIMCR